MSQTFEKVLTNLREFGAGKKSELDSLFEGHSTWLANAVNEVKQQIAELGPAAKKQKLNTGQSASKAADTKDVELPKRRGRRNKAPAADLDTVGEEQPLQPASQEEVQPNEAEIAQPADEPAAKPTRAARNRRGKKQQPVVENDVADKEPAESQEPQQNDTPPKAKPAAKAPRATRATRGKAKAEAAVEQPPVPEETPAAPPAAKGRATRSRKGAAAKNAEEPAKPESVAAAAEPPQETPASAPSAAAGKRKKRGAAAKAAAPVAEPSQKKSSVRPRRGKAAAVDVAEEPEAVEAPVSAAAAKGAAPKDVVEKEQQVEQAAVEELAAAQAEVAEDAMDADFEVEIDAGEPSPLPVAPAVEQQQEDDVITIAENIEEAAVVAPADEEEAPLPVKRPISAPQRVLVTAEEAAELNNDSPAVEAKANKGGAQRQLLNATEEERDEEVDMHADIPAADINENAQDNDDEEEEQEQDDFQGATATDNAAYEPDENVQNKGLAANLVSTIRSFLPISKAEGAAPGGLKPKPAPKLKAIEAAAALRRKEEQKIAERANQKAAAEKARLERLKAKAEQEAEEARKKEEMILKKEREAAQRKKEREETERKEREEKYRRLEELKAKRAKEEAAAQASKPKDGENRAANAAGQTVGTTSLAEAKERLLKIQQAAMFKQQGGASAATTSTSIAKPPPAASQQPSQLPAPPSSSAVAAAPPPVAKPLSQGPMTYEISPYKSDHDSDDDQPKKPVPEWARGRNLQAQLISQMYVDPDEIFLSHHKTCSLDEVFAHNDTKIGKQDFNRRTSSGNWFEDRVTWKEELSYKKAMGYL